ncbi:MAG: hypothetical protein Q9228_004538 [Teloschistes exilis]
MVLPNLGAHWHATELDLTMMSTLASMERSEIEWRNLLERAGLQIQTIESYTEDTRDTRPPLNPSNPYARDPPFDDPDYLLWRFDHNASCTYFFASDAYGALGVLAIVLRVWCGWQDVEGDPKCEPAVGWGLGRYNGDHGGRVVWCRAYTLGLVSRGLFLSREGMVGSGKGAQEFEKGEPDGNGIEGGTSIRVLALEARVDGQVMIEHSKCRTEKSGSIADKISLRDREWQKWPVTIITGAYIGWAVGRLAGEFLFKGKRIEFDDYDDLEPQAENEKP